MKTVYKYAVQPGGLTYMPKGAELLHAAMQNSTMVVWARIDMSQPVVHRHLEVFGTGHMLPDNSGTHVSTVFDGQLVWHLFDRGEI